MITISIIEVVFSKKIFKISYFCKKLINTLTTTILHKNELGYGFYTYADIAQLLGLPRAKVNRYLSAYWNERLGKSLFNEDFS